MSISVFLLTVTHEFGAYRVKLEGHLTVRMKDIG